MKKRLFFLFILLLIILIFNNYSTAIEQNGNGGSPPTSPSSLQATVISTTQIQLNWQDNSNNEQGFKIERRTNLPIVITYAIGVNDFVQIAIVSANTITYLVNGLDPNQDYEFRIRAYNAYGNSAYSNIIDSITYLCNPNTCNPNNNQQICNSQGTGYNNCNIGQVCSNKQCVTQLQPQPPQAPSNLQVSTLSSTQIQLNWQDNSNNEQGFKIERRTNLPIVITYAIGVNDFVQIAIVSANINTYTDSGLSSNTLYEYRVRAYNSAGNSAYSNIADTTTLLSQCTSTCNQGSRRCSGNGYQICQDSNGDGCYEWNSIRICTQSQTCSQGYCSSQILNRCSDNTLFSQCSINKPKYCNNGVLINNCNLCGCNNNGICLPDGSCISSFQYQRSLDQNLLREGPKLRYTPKFTLPLNQIFTLNLNNYVYDLNNRAIAVMFLDNQQFYSNEFVNCNLSNNQLNCELKNSGNTIINLVANNGFKDIEFSLNLEIIEIPSLAEKPVANAGQDISVILDSYFVLDGSLSYDSNNDLIDDGFRWYENEQLLGIGKTLRLKYVQLGLHTIKLVVTDSKGLTVEDQLLVNVILKNKCKNTKTKYFPQDTLCNDKWPSQDGKIIIINSKDYSCNLVEVCDDSTDYIIEDALDCCDGTTLTDPRKTQSCSFANQYSNSNSKRCQALYIIKSLGADQVYMQDYLEAEMCCRGVEELCGNKNYLYTSNPKPNTETNLNNLRCYNSPSDNPPGSWVSDIELEKNNIALSDVPTHVSLNQLSTGTCVDYSFSVTTLLRKLGYKKSEIITVEAPNHAYNLVRFPLDKKYTIVDTTGNNEPPIVFGSVPYGYGYCENIKNCYNDYGRVICPRLTEINGCENVKESFVKESRFVGLEIKNKITEFYNLFIGEIQK